LHKETSSIKDVYDDTLTLELAKPIEKFIKNLWPDFKADGDLTGLIGLYPKNDIMKDPDSSYVYALHVIKSRWPEAEPIIMKDPETAHIYALHVIKGRWPEAEPTIMKDPGAADNYKRYVYRLG